MINTEDFNAREFEERGAISLSLPLLRVWLFLLALRTRFVRNRKRNASRVLLRYVYIFQSPSNRSRSLRIIIQSWDFWYSKCELFDFSKKKCIKEARRFKSFQIISRRGERGGMRLQLFRRTSGNSIAQIYEKCLPGDGKRRRDDPRRFYENLAIEIDRARRQNRPSPIIIGGSRGKMLVYRAELA